jgi:hypothetical protein
MPHVLTNYKLNLTNLFSALPIYAFFGNSRKGKGLVEKTSWMLREKVDAYTSDLI